MPRPKKRAARAKIAYTKPELLRFATGIVISRDRFGRGPEAAERMALAWREDAELRERVYELFQRRQNEGRVGNLVEPWATRLNIHGNGREAETSPSADANAAGTTKPRLRGQRAIDRTKRNINAVSEPYPKP